MSHDNDKAVAESIIELFNFVLGKTKPKEEKKLTEYERGFREGKEMGERNSISWVKHMLEIVDCKEPETLEMFKEIIGKFDNVFQSPKTPQELLSKEWYISDKVEINSNSYHFHFKHLETNKKFQYLARSEKEAWSLLKEHIQNIERNDSL